VESSKKRQQNMVYRDAYSKHFRNSGNHLYFLFQQEETAKQPIIVNETNDVVFVNSGK